MPETGAEILVNDGAEKSTPTPPPASGTRPIDPARRLDGGGKALEYLGLSPAEFFAQLKSLDPEEGKKRMQALRNAADQNEFLKAVLALVRDENNALREQSQMALANIGASRAAAVVDADAFVEAVNASSQVFGIVTERKAATEELLGGGDIAASMVEPLKPAA